MHVVSKSECFYDYLILIIKQILLMLWPFIFFSSRQTTLSASSSEKRNLYTGRFCLVKKMQKVRERFVNGTETYMKRVVPRCPWSSLYCNTRVRWVLCLLTFMSHLYLKFKNKLIVMTKPNAGKVVVEKIKFQFSREQVVAWYIFHL